MQRLYVAKGEGHIVKVGRSANIDEREAFSREAA